MTTIRVTIDGTLTEAKPGERLVDLEVNRTGAEGASSLLSPAADRFKPCVIEADGQLVRSCATPAGDGMIISTQSSRAISAQREAFDEILGNHMLYCTVCDNNNGNCTVHNTTKFLAVEHQKIPFKTKPYEVDSTNPFYRYDPDQCILCGRCVEACQNVEVNETLSIAGRTLTRACCGTVEQDWRVELRFLRSLCHGLLCNALMGENPCLATPDSLPASRMTCLEPG